MTIENETREIFMSLPTWNARDALRLLLEIDPDSISLDDDFDGSEIEVEARALIGWLYRYGILPRAIREPYDSAPELISEYLDAIGDVRRTPAEWIAAAVANPGAPVEWLESLQSVSGAPKQGGRAVSVSTHKIKTRSNFLDPVIDQAKKTATNSGDYQSVWAALVALAESAPPPPPLVGYSSDGIQYRGNQYERTQVHDVFTKDALRKRMNKLAR